MINFLKKIIGRIRNKKLEKVMQYYNRFPLLKEAPTTFYQILMLYSEPINLGFSEILINYNQPVKGIYILIKGTVKVRVFIKFEDSDAVSKTEDKGRQKSSC